MWCSIAVSHAVRSGIAAAPEPATCMVGAFSSATSGGLKTVTLRIINQCHEVVDMQNTTITFKNKTSLNVPFWGNFSPLSPPINTLVTHAEVQSDKKYLVTMHFQLPIGTGSRTKLPYTSSIKLEYQSALADYDPNSIKVYVGSAGEGGSLTVSNRTTKPSRIKTNSAVVHVMSNGLSVTDIDIPWQSQTTSAKIPVGAYQLTAENLKDQDGNTYRGNVTPSTVTISKDTTASASLFYQVGDLAGKLGFRVQQKPAELSDYQQSPMVTIKPAGEVSEGLTRELHFGTTTTVDGLLSGTSYDLSSFSIEHGLYTCSPMFSPRTIVAKADFTPIVSLIYACQPNPTVETLVRIQVDSGHLDSIELMFTPENGSAPVQATIPIQQGFGEGIVTLRTGGVYHLSTKLDAPLLASFVPQPLTALEGEIEQISVHVQALGI